MKIILPTCLLLLMFLLTSCVPMRTEYADLRQTMLARTPELIENTPAPIPDQLTLIEAKRLALRDNPSLEALKYRIDAARNRYREAYTAYYPQLSAQLGARHYDRTPSTQIFGGTSFSSGSQGYETYDGSLTLSWLIFDGLTRDHAALAARYAVDAGTAAREDAQRLLAQAVARFFYSALLAQKRMQISIADQDFNQSFLDDTQKRRDQGAASRADVLNFRIRLDDARISYLDARNDYRIACIVLNELMGYPGAAINETITFIEPPPSEVQVPESLSESLSIALVKRPDLVELMADMKAAQALMRARRGLYLPRISTDATMIYSNPTADVSSDDIGLSWGVNATYDFLGSGAHYFAAQEAEALRAAANLDITSRWQAIVSDIRQQAQSLNNAREKSVIQQEILESTRTIRGDVENAYKAGQVSLTRLNEAQRDLIIADERYALDQIQVLLAGENLAAAIGINTAGLITDDASPQ